MLVTTLWRCRCSWFWFPPYRKEGITSFVISAIAKLWIEGPTSLSHQGCLSRSRSSLVEWNYKFRLLHVDRLMFKHIVLINFKVCDQVRFIEQAWHHHGIVVNLLWIWVWQTYVCPYFNSFNFDVYDSTIENLCNLQNARFSLCFKHSGRMQIWEIMFIT